MATIQQISSLFRVFLLPAFLAKTYTNSGLKLHSEQNIVALTQWLSISGMASDLDER
jgi:hypothetical protein